MNPTPTPQKTAPVREPITKPHPSGQAPKSPLPDWTFLSLLACSVLVCIVTLVFLIVLNQGPAKPKDGEEITTEAETESNVDPNHTAVTYPTDPSRNSYLFAGDGTAIESTDLSATSAILVSLKDYSVKASIAADARIYPASMTKIMTLIIACENIKDATVKLTISTDVYNYCTSEGAPVTVIDPGDSFTATDLLYSVGVVSAADAAITLADHIFGSEEAFVEKMNEKAQALGLTATHFANCTGLDNDENYSTAREMAVILAYALDNDFCRTVLSTETITVTGYYEADGVEKTYNRYLNNTLLERLEGAGYKKTLPCTIPSGMTLLGGKTGFTDKGKYCLAAFAEDENGDLYVTVTAAGEKMRTSLLDMNTIYEKYR